MPKPIRAYKNRHGVAVNIGTKNIVADGLLTAPRPAGYTDEMLSKDIRSARQAMMTANGPAIIQARKDIKTHIEHVENTRKQGARA